MRSSCCEIEDYVETIFTSCVWFSDRYIWYFLGTLASPYGFISNEQLCFFILFLYFFFVSRSPLRRTTYYLVVTLQCYERWSLSSIPIVVVRL